MMNGDEEEDEGSGCNLCYSEMSYVFVFWSMPGDSAVCQWATVNIEI